MDYKVCSACQATMDPALAACAKCGQPFAAPAMEDSVPCPHCAEPIKRAAVKCRWCNRALGGGPAAPEVSKASEGTVSFVMGLVALIGGFGCGLFWLLGPVAWVLGHTYLKRCRAAGAKPDSLGTAGMILGIVSTVLGVLVVVLTILGFTFMIGLVALAEGSR